MRTLIDMFRFFPLQTLAILLGILFIVWIIVKLIHIVGIILVAALVVCGLLWIKDRLKR